MEECKGVEGVKSSFAISLPSVHINHGEEDKATWLKMSVNDAKQPLQDLIVYIDIRNSVGNNVRWNVLIAWKKFP